MEKTPEKFRVEFSKLLLSRWTPHPFFCPGPEASLIFGVFFFRASNKERSEGERLGAPQPLLPPPLARTRGVSRPWPTPDCRGQVGGCLPNSARAPNTSCCCAHTQACTNTHTNPLPAPPNTHNIHQHPDAHRQPGKEASRRRSR